MKISADLYFADIFHKKSLPFDYYVFKMLELAYPEIYSLCDSITMKKAVLKIRIRIESGLNCVSGSGLGISGCTNAYPGIISKY